LGTCSIVGKGNHSANHVQKIKPRVEQVCRELGLQYHTEENAGRIYINLKGDEAIPPPHHNPYQPPSAGYPGSYGGQQQHHGGQQQHHGGGHQQQQQQQPDEVEKLIGKLVKKLGDCCVVM
jgi:hypothetical protein